jgi:hypothetical protein
MTLKPDLKKVTCVLIEGEDPNIAAIVLNGCAEQCNFYDVVLISFERPTQTEYNYKFILIDKLSFTDYNKFVVSKLHKYIHSEFCLLIQWDGFVLNPNAWQDNFLNYDYIGAPWYVNKFTKNFLVGNGGFSLRSKKYLQTTAQLHYDGKLEEDIFCCRENKKWMIEQNIKFAPHELAYMFSVENYKYTNQFGFHGKDTIGINYYNKSLNHHPLWNKIKNYVISYKISKTLAI